MPSTLATRVAEYPGPKKRLTFQLWQDYVPHKVVAVASVACAKILAPVPLTPDSYRPFPSDESLHLRPQADHHARHVKETSKLSPSPLGSFPLPESLPEAKWPQLRYSIGEASIAREGLGSGTSGHPGPTPDKHRQQPAATAKATYMHACIHVDN